MAKLNFESDGSEPDYPQLTALDSLGQRYNLAVDSARAHPEVPMLLAWSPAEVPDACRDPSRDPGASTSGARCGARPSCPAAPDSGSARRGADAGVLR